MRSPAGRAEEASGKAGAGRAGRTVWQQGRTGQLQGLQMAATATLQHPFQTTPLCPSLPSLRLPPLEPSTCPPSDSVPPLTVKLGLHHKWLQHCHLPPAFENNMNRQECCNTHRQTWSPPQTAPGSLSPPLSPHPSPLCASERAGRSEGEERGQALKREEEAGRLLAKFGQRGLP